MQNKANSPVAKMTPTAIREKGYGKAHGLCLCKNKANFHGRHCFPAFARAGLAFGLLAMT
jgi:hypothetical protein